MMIPRWLVASALCVRLALAASPAQTAPLCPGLTIVTAISQPDGDYESIKTIESVEGGAVRLKYSNQQAVRNASGSPSSFRTLITSRAIREEDLRTGMFYLQQFHSTPLEVPGTTAIGVSSAMLSALKTGGEAELIMFDLPNSLPASPKLFAAPSKHPSVFDYQIRFKIRRFESAPVMVPLTVNGAKSELRAVHATGAAEFGEKGEFFFLDDPNNPLALKWRVRLGSLQPGAGDRDTLQVVKIDYRCSSPTAGPGRLERSLAEDRRADVYDIYFSFNSDQIREESEPALSELGDLLRRHSDWKLSIEGHTDGIAGDAFNLDLSKRRAAAVKNALVTRFGIGDGRLTTTGFGKSRPRDTNETPEGRARNRRVELVRLP